MSRRLVKQLDVERELLRDLVSEYSPLVAELRKRQPTQIEIVALGSVLHSFYNGVENALKRVERELGKDLHSSQDWHAQLLQQAGEATDYRQPVFEPSLISQLRGYLEFRHVFRHAYVAQLDWVRMSPLVFELPHIAERLDAELANFIKDLPSGGEP